MMIEHDLRTQPKKPGFFTKILRFDPQILSKTRFLEPPSLPASGVFCDWQGKLVVENEPMRFVAASKREFGDNGTYNLQLK